MKIVIQFLIDSMRGAGGNGNNLHLSRDQQSLPQLIIVRVK